MGGSFSEPFAPPGPNCPNETEGSPPGTPTEGPPAGRTAADITCKPAAVNIVVLPDGRILYWDGLEAEEDVQYSEVLEFGDKAVQDQSRILSLDPSEPSASSYTTPVNPGGGADNSPYTQYLLPNSPGALASALNDPGQAPAALFCSDQVLLDNGTVLTPGGTQYYSEPHVPGTPYGVAELEGVRSTRIFNPATNTWTQSSPMNYGRWYPSLVTLANGEVFVASGVTKLIKPVYTSDPLMSGTNVEQTETYNPATGTWLNNGPGASRSLPLYPRLHLLPDGHVYYDAGGQTFNPSGQSYDEALWNIAASYNPQTKTWTNLGIPAGVSLDTSRLTDTAIAAGFRGSTFSVMLPLTPDQAGRYGTARFLSAGGVLGTTPGAYLANTSSVIDTVTIGSNGQEHFSSLPTAPLNNARWFSTAVVLPTGQVIAFSGANRDEVVGPGTAFAIRQAEMFNPATKTWTPLASAHDERTYHNVAVLLPDAQVLVGGSAPINTLYGYDQTLPGGLANGFRDPSFELYSPPYLHWGIPQPTITSISADSLGYGKILTISSPQAASITQVTLVRNPALTHEVDGDQRSVDLPILARHGNQLTVSTPPSGSVAPPGPYMVFVDRSTPKGLVPSIADQVWVGAPVPRYLQAQLASQDRVSPPAAVPGQAGTEQGGPNGIAADGDARTGSDRAGYPQQNFRAGSQPEPAGGTPPRVNGVLSASRQNPTLAEVGWLVALVGGLAATAAALPRWRRNRRLRT